MTTSDGHQDAAEPLDALRRVVGAIASGQVELEPQDLHAISRLRDDSSDTVGQQLGALDAEGRFALIERLRQVGDDYGGYDFTVIFGAMTTDEDASVRTVAVTGLGQCETAGATRSLLRVAKSIEEEDAVRREAVSALGDVAMRVELGWAASEDAGDVVPSLRTIAEDATEDEELRASALSAVAVVSDEMGGRPDRDGVRQRCRRAASRGDRGHGTQRGRVLAAGAGGLARGGG